MAAISSASNLQMKNQLQGAANNIISNNNLSAQENAAQYEDLKKKLLTEYKKIQKKGGGTVYQQSQGQSQVNDHSLNQHIEQTLQNTANAMSQSQQQVHESAPNGGNLQNS